MFKRIIIALLAVALFASVAYAQLVTGAPQSLVLKEGFNFVAFTVKPAMTAAAFKAANTAIQEIYGFSASSGSFISVSEGTLQTLAAGRGYIIRCAAAATIPVNGEAIGTIGQIQLKAGFNLVGISKTIEPVKFSAFMAQTQNVKGLYKWNAMAGSFTQVIRNVLSNIVEQLDGIDPTFSAGQSYFMNVTSDTTMTYDGGLLLIGGSQGTTVAKVMNVKYDAAGNKLTWDAVTHNGVAALYFVTIDNQAQMTAQSNFFQLPTTLAAGQHIAKVRAVLSTDMANPGPESDPLTFTVGGGQTGDMPPAVTGIMYDSAAKLIKWNPITTTHTFTYGYTLSFDKGPGTVGGTDPVNIATNPQVSIDGQVTVGGYTNFRIDVWVNYTDTAVPVKGQAVNFTFTTTGQQTGPFALTSPAFQNNGAIAPKQLDPGTGNNGAMNLSPLLTWAQPTPNTKSFALICEDLTVPTVHWAIYNIPAASNALPEGIGEGATVTVGGITYNQAKNYLDKFRYDGPNPPQDNLVHQYRFTLYCLTQQALAANLTVDGLRAEIAKDQTFGNASITGTYKFGGDTTQTTTIGKVTGLNYDAAAKKIKWTAVQPPAGSNQAYAYRVNLDGVDQPNPTPMTEFQIAATIPDGAHTVKVQALIPNTSPEQAGQYSDIFTFTATSGTTGSTIPAPMGVMFDGDSGTINWVPVLGDGTTVYSYRVYLDNATSPEVVMTASYGLPATIATGAAAGHTVKVEAMLAGSNPPQVGPQGTLANNTFYAYEAPKYGTVSTVTNFRFDSAAQAFKWDVPAGSTATSFRIIAHYKSQGITYTNDKYFLDGTINTTSVSLATVAAKVTSKSATDVVLEVAAVNGLVTGIKSNGIKYPTTTTPTTATPYFSMTVAQPTTVPSAAGVLRAPIAFDQTKHEVKVYDQVSGTVYQPGGNPADPAAYAVPIDGTPKTVISEVRDKATGNVLYRNVVGKCPLASELPANAKGLKLNNVQLDDKTTALAALGFEKGAVSQLNTTPAFNFANVAPDASGIIAKTLASGELSTYAQALQNKVGGEAVVTAVKMAREAVPMITDGIAAIESGVAQIPVDTINGTIAIPEPYNTQNKNLKAALITFKNELVGVKAMIVTALNAVPTTNIPNPKSASDLIAAYIKAVKAEDAFRNSLSAFNANLMPGIGAVTMPPTGAPAQLNLGNSVVTKATDPATIPNIVGQITEIH